MCLASGGEGGRTATHLFDALPAQRPGQDHNTPATPSQAPSFLSASTIHASTIHSHLRACCLSQSRNIWLDVDNDVMEEVRK